MSARNTVTLFATTAAIALMGARPVLAQSDQPTAKADTGIEEVVVTARGAAKKKRSRCRSRY